MTDKIIALLGDSREVLVHMGDNSFDSCCTDPPYALVSIVKRFGKPGAAPAKEGTDGRFTRQGAGFMGQTWDNGETAFDPDFWREVYRVLKPGAHLAAFSGTRTYHRMAVAIEDAGFEIRDQIGWAYGSGFPKSHDVSKGIDRAAGASGPRGRGFNVAGQNVGLNQNRELRSDHPDYIAPTATTDAARQWEGWGTALKPAWEPICLARKPLSEGTVAANVLRWGTGALNIDGCRVECDGGSPSAQMRQRSRETGIAPGRPGEYRETLEDRTSPERYMQERPGESKGRWPANIVHDGSDEVVGAFPDTTVAGSSDKGLGNKFFPGGGSSEAQGQARETERGSAARFFYTAKADADDRLGSGHPTVKPVDLMQWLVRLITPPGGHVLEPFAGTGTTGEAAFREKMGCTMIEREAKFHADILRRISLMESSQAERRRESVKEKIKSGRLSKDKIAPAPLFRDHE